MKKVVLFAVLAVTFILSSCNHSTPIPEDSPVYGKVEIINGKLKAKDGYTLTESKVKSPDGQSIVALMGRNGIEGNFSCGCGASNDGCHWTLSGGLMTCGELVCKDCSFWVEVDSWSQLAPEN